MLIWEKGINTGMGNLRIPWKPNHEEIYVFGKGDGFTGRRTSGVLHFSYEGVGAARMHRPSSRLPSCGSFLARRSASSSILRGLGLHARRREAARRRAIGVELDASYCHVAAERLRETKVIV